MAAKICRNALWHGLVVFMLGNLRMLKLSGGGHLLQINLYQRHPFLAQFITRFRVPEQPPSGTFKLIRWLDEGFPAKANTIFKD